MTALDLSRPHVVLGPHEYTPGRWWGACSCGEEFFGTSADSIRQQFGPHREAGRQRLSEVERKAADVG